jgi:hypothetical protein
MTYRPKFKVGDIVGNARYLATRYCVSAIIGNKYKFKGLAGIYSAEYLDAQWTTLVNNGLDRVLDGLT